MFSPLLMPVDDLGPNENPLVHLVDMIPDYKEAIDKAVLAKEYKAWFKDRDWSKLSPPFGLKGPVPDDALVQFALVPLSDGGYCIYKHCIFPSRIKIQQFRRIIYGTPQKLRFPHPKTGFKVFHYCFENMGCQQFRC
jgi:hypothetical protein